jgi:ATP-binding cassette, subfamily F, member 3
MTLQLNAISKQMGLQPLFDELSLQLTGQSRVGLIGRNGAGKSTLLKLLAGLIEPDEGNVFKTPGFRVRYLSQEPSINDEATLYDELSSVFIELNALDKEEEALFKKMEDPALPEAEQLKLSDRLEKIYSEKERHGAYEKDARIGRMLKGMGFTEDEYDRLCSTFSGGWQMRINLAKVLLEGADLLLLDEPTNHLDLETCEWLEGFLGDYSGGLVVVSHDRHFLDKVITHTVEIEFGKAFHWPGNYSEAVELKAAWMENLQSAQSRQEKELSKQTAFVERFKASATRGTQAKSREKQLAKIERVTVHRADDRKMRLRFPTPVPSGRDAIVLKDVDKAFGENLLFNELNALLEREQRVFVLGANGCGKTTLFRLILELEKPDNGVIQLGHNVVLGYFSQHQLETLDPELDAFQTLQQACPKMDNTELRTLLGRFLFTGDQVFKKVGVLSGGEKSKLALAKLMMSGANTLLLDEPTNHMDIPSKEVMAEAFGAYEGSIICISHDRYFIQQLATQIWDFHQKRLMVYEGDYEYYLQKRSSSRTALKERQNKNNGKNKAQPEATAAVKKAPESQFAGRKEKEKQLKKLEAAILRAEQLIGSVEVEMLAPNLAYNKMSKLSHQLETAQAELKTLNEQWEALTHQLV